MSYLAARAPFVMKGVVMKMFTVSVVFNPTSYSADEGGFVVILVTTISSLLSVIFRTVDGTAVSTINGDYIQEERTINFEPGGSTVVFINVQTTTDNVPEQTETFTAELFQGEQAGGVTISEETATIQIADASGNKENVHTSNPDH